MMFKQFYLESLGHASYLIGSEETGEALVLDPRRDVDVYFPNARQEGVLIAFAVDTHQHNDYLSGARELSHRGGVEILASASAQIGYPARPLKEGERLEIGEIFLEVLQTPGHTPEHISLLVRDRSLGEEPVLLLSGGSLSVGDVARPDLLGGAEATREAACSLCHTLQTKILPLLQRAGGRGDPRLPCARGVRRRAHSRRAQRRHRKRLSDLGRDGSAGGGEGLARPGRPGGSLGDLRADQGGHSHFRRGIARPDRRGAP